MPGSEGKRNFSLLDLILILLVLGLIYLLYVYSGGDLLALFRPETYVGGDNLFDSFIGSLRGFGQGLGDMFRGMVR
jgi:hypothetical protein